MINQYENIVLNREFIMKQIKRLVVSELNFYRDECNFTDEERQYFDLKAKDASDIKVSMELNISIAKVNKLSRQVRSKMERVENLYNVSKLRK